MSYHRAPGFDRPPDETAPDLEIVDRVIAGEGNVYVVLVRRYQERLYRYAIGMVLDGDAAADLVQETFIKAYTGLAKCRDRSKFGTWVFQILRNRCLDYLKARQRRDLPLHDQPDIPTTDCGPDYNLETQELRNVLERALSQLPETQREAFLLKHVHDLTYEEMAEVVGASVSALRMRVLRAREMLQAIVGEENKAGAARSDAPRCSLV
jgi:RNA polymerase sigma-70 factor, ECF subfamily